MNADQLRIDGQGYRPDIDGLRAVAVLAVVFFHVGFAPFGGGYVGVDVFFVISGFLITRLICGQVQAGTFSFAQFYARRARRLFPALYFTVLVSFGFAAWLFSPADLERFARSVVFTILSLSNVLFWRESGYFDASADVKPLLHTWSLSVEEQFYLVWPVTLVVLTWAGRRLSARRSGFEHAWIVPAFLIAAGLLSLVLTEICLEYSPPATFYLPMFRVSEFAIGGLMVWLVARRSPEPALLEPLVLVGLALIAWPVFAYSEETVFPGLAALPPCIGTAILIYAGTAPRLGRLLSNRVAVGIGLISYSLYLVHWPMIVFYTYWIVRPLTAVEQFAIVGASIALATGMYFFVETPFRRAVAKSGAWSPGRFGLVCACLAALLIVPAASAWSSAGWPSRLPREIREAVADLEAKRDATWKMARPLSRKKRFARGKTAILVVGDSHGKDMTNALAFAAERLGDTLDVVYRPIQTQCQPYIGPRAVSAVLTQGAIDRCNAEVRKLIESPLVRSADYIVFSVRWDPVGAVEVGRTIDAIRKRSEAKIIVFARTVEFDDVPSLLARYRAFDGFDRYIAAHRFDVSALNRTLRDVAEDRDVTFVAREPLICPQEDACFAFDEAGRLLFYDYGHWTLDGARFFGNRMVDEGILEFLKGRRNPPS
ncbi:acyltransferase family protein [Microbaculum marinum]|uniref:Acyltransferase family protein n=1 Tax=Microbaculum marinum TaxID=1764581 RepID=A0AAW9S0Y0_9HYPH